MPLDPFFTTVNIVGPLFLLIALGCFLRWRGLLDEPSCRRINALAFNVLIPAMVFYNIYTADLGVTVDPGLLLFTFVSVTIVFLLLLLAVPLFMKDPAKIGVVIQGVFRSNFVVLGMGLAGTMYPGRSLGVMAITSALVAPMFNVYAVIALALFSKERSGLGHTTKLIIRNPLIIASVLALVLLLTGVRIPAVAQSAVASLSGTASTISLIVLGGELSFSGVRGDRWSLAFTCFMKLVVLPLIFIPVAVAMGFRGMELLCVLILFGSPAAVSSHAMAVQAKGDGQLAAQIVVLTTCLSAFSLFGFIYTLLTLGYL